ncbi:DUF2459 domain-containing protein [Qipengyuania sphaerica]|uniref:DUF2459 domain-containing protein n=1 Tax=Qipengyuania sphaerica TaxID=2867243 RepID=UPI0031E7313B
MTKHRLLRIAAWIIGIPALAVILFLLSAWIGSSIPRNSDWTQPERGIEIMVGDNGIHTEIVMPLVSNVKDWRTDFPASDLPAPNRPYTHVAVSWGEREVFLNTPTWGDLDLSTALNAATGGDGLIHASHYVRPAPGPSNRPLRLTEAQYAKLVAAIEAQVPSPEDREVYPGYADWDVFYDAPGTYHLANTCNQWTADTLAEAGVKMGSWTPMPGGVMKWIEEPAAN